MTQTQAKTVKRVVVGGKMFHGCNHQTGKRYTAVKGDTVEVSPAVARAFPHRLMDARVAEANAKADEAIAEAQAEERTAEAAANKADADPTPPTPPAKPAQQGTQNPAAQAGK